MNPNPKTAVSHGTEGHVPFFEIPLAMLKLDMVTGFDLYLPPRSGKTPVLYREGELPFTDVSKKRLASNNVETLFISGKPQSLYNQYVERTLGDVLNDRSIPKIERSTALYNSARGLVKEAMEDPRSGDLIERSSAMIDNTVSFLYNDSESFDYLMRISSYDYYTYTHSVNVFVFMTALAQRLGYSLEEVKDASQGALLHDIGKSELDPAIIQSTGALTDDQWVQMKLHPVHGYDILVEQGVTNEVILDVVRHHHEKIDGSGYPDGLAGDEISHWSRICTIADIFDAMTTRRSYKDAKNSFKTLRIMNDEMVGQIDMDFFKEFITLMGRI
jgi:putative nucleotidyltransferase with HDIG domain